jgi:hypothetical protein
MTRLAQDDIRMKNRAGLSGTQVSDGDANDTAALTQTTYSVTDEQWNSFSATAGVLGNVKTPPKVMPLAKKMGLRAAYERYKIGKGFGRADLFIAIIDEIEQLQARIGAVDEARVAELDARMSALERTIGNALSAATPEKRGPGRPAKKAETEE